MNGIFENCEEFFISEDPQEIEREKQRRQAIHALLPERAGGKKDTTIYVLRKDSTANNSYLQQGMSQETGQKKKTTNFEGNVPSGNGVTVNNANRQINYTQVGSQIVDNILSTPQKNLNNRLQVPFIDDKLKAEIETHAKANALYRSNENKRKENKDDSSGLYDVLSFATGGYAPHRPVKAGETPWGTDIEFEGPIGSVLNYMEMKNIDEWENENEKRNKKKRETLSSMKKWPIVRQITNAYENFMDIKELREATFPTKSMTHLIAAIDNGLGISDGDNLASVADRFASEYDKYFVNKDSEYKDRNMFENIRNTLRHTIWQATLASQYNPQVAYDAAMAHETRPYADTSQRIFYTESEADMVTDLLNNRIGRKLGHNNKKSSIKEIALLVLDEFWKNGLYTYEMEDNGLYYIKKKKMSDQSYMDVYNSILKLDNNGRE